ncbi:heme peroxidase [Pestalotiopsis sp. NC0098]|nr:heme peroxidase [Pestalotiopsis sp. NC0098]
MYQATIVFGLLGHAAGAYVWPSQYDFLEDILAIQSGVTRFGFSDLVVPCGFGSGVTGQQNSAEWVRSVFHDMITHDASAGTGGLDASLQFELERPENTGSAFNNTFGAMNDFITPRSSVSDMLALSLVAAVAACDGPRVPLRAGRVDATEAGPAGVPKPEDDLDSNHAAFSKAGFTNEEMITMVACGHSLGNIHSVDFPDLVSGEATAANVGHFDSSPASFDNAVVTEYLADDTLNPLVVGTNDTTNSDKRIFASDGNSTMSTLADPATFQSKCVEIFERMIDTVPSTVTLSEPLEIVDVKPYVDALQMQDDGSILFQGRVRVRNNPDRKLDGDDLTVSLQYRDRSGASVPNTIVANREVLRGGQSYGFWGNVFTWFDFSTSLPADTAISSFDIQLNTTSTGDVLLLDNEGTGGFPVVSDLLYQKSDSGIVSNGAAWEMTVTTALRQEMVSANELPELRLYRKIPKTGVMLPRLQLETISFGNTTDVVKGGYQYFEAKAVLEAASLSTTFDIASENNGKETAVEFLRTGALPIN